jgi:hypothetical protein
MLQLIKVEFENAGSALGIKPTPLRQWRSGVPSFSSILKLALRKASSKVIEPGLD